MNAPAPKPHNKPGPDMLAAALDYAARGIPVFPCGTDKAPITKNGFYAATTDKDMIVKWWRSRPDAMIGMPTGPASGIDVLDLDVDPTKGKNGLNKIAGGWETLSPTIVRTPRGGRHLWFKSSGVRNSTDKIYHGVDTRGGGGYVILPPSWNAVGAYSFVEADSLEHIAVLPPFPPGFLKLVVGDDAPHEPNESLVAEDKGKIVFAMSVIENDNLSWTDWNWLGMALYAATEGSDDGREAFEAFSHKSSKNNQRDTSKRWNSYRKSPPTEIGAGTIMLTADEARPGWRDDYDARQMDEVARLEYADEYLESIGANKMDAPEQQESVEPERQQAAPQSVTPKQQVQPRISNAKQPGKKTIQLLRASTFDMRAQDWIWKGHLLRGTLEIMSGNPGLGKSQVQISLIAAVTTTDVKWPDGTDSGPAMDVIMLTAEDTIAETVRPRLQAARADATRVHILPFVSTPQGDRQFLLSEDLEQLEQGIREIRKNGGDIGLITIDPITAFMGKLDSNSATDVRGRLGPVMALAERMHVAISAITHPAKNSSHKSLNNFIGSQAFIAAARIGHVLGEEMKEGEAEEGSKKPPKPVPTGRILFANNKNNVHRKTPTLAYEIELHTWIDEKSGREISTSCVKWAAEPVDITADELAAMHSGIGTPHGRPAEAARGAQVQVQTWLEAQLIGGKPVPAAETEQAALAAGFTKNQLRTAREKLGIGARKMGEHWFWAFAF